MNVEQVAKSVTKGRLRHAWALGLIAIAVIGYIAPVALQSMLLVGGKCYVGAVIGVGLHFAIDNYGDRDDVRDESWMWRCVALMSAGMLAMSLGV